MFDPGDLGPAIFPHEFSGHVTGEALRVTVRPDYVMGALTAVESLPTIALAGLITPWVFAAAAAYLSRRRLRELKVVPRATVVLMAIASPMVSLVVWTAAKGQWVLAGASAVMWVGVSWLWALAYAGMKERSSSSPLEASSQAARSLVTGRQDRSRLLLPLVDVRQEKSSPAWGPGALAVRVATVVAASAPAVVYAQMRFEEPVAEASWALLVICVLAVLGVNQWARIEPTLWRALRPFGARTEALLDGSHLMVGARIGSLVIGAVSFDGPALRVERAGDTCVRVVTEARVMVLCLRDTTDVPVILELAKA